MQICIIFTFPAILCHSACNFMDFLKLFVASFVRYRFTDLLFAWAPPSQQYGIKEPRLDGALLPSILFYPALVLSLATFVFYLFSLPCSVPGATSVFLPFSLPFSLSLSQSLFHSLTKKIVSFDFYLKTATGTIIV